jgi:hypothetical protein
MFFKLNKEQVRKMLNNEELLVIFDQKRFNYIKNERERLSFMKPKHVSTPIHIENSLLGEKKDEHRMPMPTKSNFKPHKDVEYRFNSLPNKHLISSYPPLNKERINKYNCYIPRISPNFTTPNQNRIFNSRMTLPSIFFRRPDQLHENFQSSYNLLQNFNAYKTFQKQQNYRLHYQPQYNSKFFHLDKFPGINSNNFTDSNRRYLMEKNVFPSLFYKRF